MNKNVKRIAILILVAIVAAVAWQFGFKPRMTRFQAWEGTLEDAYRLYDPTKYTYEPHRAEYKDFNHFWHLKCSDGQTRDVKMPYAKWVTGRIGEQVIKESGTPWPRMAEQSERGNVEQHAKEAEESQKPAGE